MENKEIETNKQSYNRLPDERNDKKVKKFDETNHVNVQNEGIKDDLLLKTNKESYNRLPDERDAEKMKNYNERSHVEGDGEQQQKAETVKESYNRIPDEPVQETSVHEKYKSNQSETKDK